MLFDPTKVDLTAFLDPLVLRFLAGALIIMLVNLGLGVWLAALKGQFQLSQLPRFLRTDFQLIASAGVLDAVTRDVQNHLPIRAVIIGLVAFVNGALIHDSWVKGLAIYNALVSGPQNSK